MLFILSLNAASLFPEIMEGGFLVTIFLSLFLLSFLKSDRGRCFTLILVVVIALYHVFSVSVFSASVPVDGNITMIGKVVGNPGMTGKRKSSFDIEVMMVRNRMDSYGSARGHLHVISKEEEISSGDEVVLSGSLLDDSLFIADSVMVKSHSLLYPIRRRCLSFVRSRLGVLPEDERELALRLILASGENASYEIGEKARAKGVSHVFALSGMHLELIFDSASLALIFIPSDDKRRKLVLIPLIVFSFLSSFGASLLRALLMRILKTFLPDLEMDETLCLSFLIQAYISPLMLLSAGGILSYMSIAAILFLSSFAEKLGRLSSSFLITSGCLLATGVYSMKTFESFTMAGLLYSPVVSILVRFYMMLLLVMLFVPLSILPWLLQHVYGVLIYILNLPDSCMDIGFDISYISTVAVFISLFLYSCGKKKGFGLCFQHCVEPELRKHKRT